MPWYKPSKQLPMILGRRIKVEWELLAVEIHMWGVWIALLLVCDCLYNPSYSCVYLDRRIFWCLPYQFRSLTKRDGSGNGIIVGVLKRRYVDLAELLSTVRTRSAFDVRIHIDRNSLNVRSLVVALLGGARKKGTRGCLQGREQCAHRETA